MWYGTQINNNMHCLVSKFDVANFLDKQFGVGRWSISKCTEFPLYGYITTYPRQDKDGMIYFDNILGYIFPIIETDKEAEGQFGITPIKFMCNLQEFIDEHTGIVSEALLECIKKKMSRATREQCKEIEKILSIGI